MSFIKPLITKIQNVSSSWYYFVSDEERYKALIKTLDIPKPTARREMCYTDSYSTSLLTVRSSNNKRNLKDCISKGDGTPAQLVGLYSTDNMERYRQSVPAFRYDAAIFPPYGDNKHHWYIRTPYNHVSLITDSKQEILDDINNPFDFTLNFVPLPNTLQ